MSECHRSRCKNTEHPCNAGALPSLFSLKERENSHACVRRVCASGFSAPPSPEADIPPNLCLDGISFVAACAACTRYPCRVQKTGSCCKDPAFRRALVYRVLTLADVWRQKLKSVSCMPVHCRPFTLLSLSLHQQRLVRSRGTYDRQTLCLSDSLHACFCFRTRIQCCPRAAQTMYLCMSAGMLQESLRNMHTRNQNTPPLTHTCTRTRDTGLCQASIVRIEAVQEAVSPMCPSDVFYVYFVVQPLLSLFLSTYYRSSTVVPHQLRPLAGSCDTGSLCGAAARTFAAPTGLLS